LPAVAATAPVPIVAAVVPPAAAPAPPPRIAAPPLAADPQDLGDRRQRAGGRREAVELLLDPAQRGAVIAAAGALTQVLARASAGAHAAIEGAREVGPDLDAGGVTGLDGLHQSDARTHEQGLDRRDGDVQRLGQVAVGQALHLAHQQCRALLVGQGADVGDQPAQVLAPLRLGHRV
jgi:hypothetical protein